MNQLQLRFPSHAGHRASRLFGDRIAASLYPRRVGLLILTVMLILAFNLSAAGQEQPHHYRGTTFVSVDSWVYSAFDRLAAIGFLDAAMMGMRPWTRVECARLVASAAGNFDNFNASATDTALYNRLREEFQPELNGTGTTAAVQIEELYARAGLLTGEPLADDYHFAKTIVNDFGRPFGHGVNVVTGSAARATYGPFAAYVRAEYQHAGALPALGTSVLQAIARADTTPFAPQQRTDSLDRVRLLDSYVSLNLHDNVVSFGKQTLWWGPGADAPFLFSNNAEPVTMLRISRATPFRLPWLFRLMGPIRLEMMWGRLEGQQFVALLDAAGNRRVIAAPLHPHPYVDGEKISFQPTRNLEFGFGVTSVFSGPGFPFTLHQILRTYSPSNTVPGLANDPGDRRSAFDFSYRLPGVRDWLTLYADSFTEDEFSPIAYPRKSAFRAGLYMPRVPTFESLDLRVEGIYTDLPNLQGTGVAYGNNHYLSGYTNYGQIIGSWIGREGRGFSAWANYHLTAINEIQLHYRNEHVNAAFLGGGSLRDFSVAGTFARTGNLVFSGSVQYERWAFPLLVNGPQTTVNVGVQVSFVSGKSWKSRWTSAGLRQP
ncbi:MAG TPA: capsule assembly Wzi family protein [Candidatus Angelobacter sp.]